MRRRTALRPRSDHTFQVTFYISRPLRDLVEFFAAHHGLSCSGAVNRLIAMGFENLRAEGCPCYDGSPGAAWADGPGDDTRISITIADDMLELLDYSAHRNDLNRSAEIRRLIAIPFREPSVGPSGEIVGHML